MGRRSRKRAPEGEPLAAPPAAPAATPRHAAPKSRRARLDEAPPAPWSPFPLVELVILVGLVLIVWAFVGGGERRTTMLAAGVALGALGGLELAVREHFAGFRSHTSILAGGCAIAVGLPLVILTGLPQLAVLAISVIAFAAAFVLFRRAFMRRSGGLGFRS